MTDKTRQNEHEYFTRESLEIINRRREELDAERERRERESHHMRCPKCGGQLAERKHHGVSVDVCQDCGGVWLDKGELEQLEHVEENRVAKYIDSLFGIRRHTR